VKRFRFRLERVLRLRRMLESQARHDLAAAVSERVVAETDRDELRERRRQGVRDLSVLQEPGPVDPRAVILCDTDIEAISRRIDLACAVVAQARETEQQRADEVAEAHRDFEVISRLRRNARETHRLEMQKEEVADLDEHTTRQRVVAAAGERER
jgi:flagellar export protein FliJ